MKRLALVSTVLVFVFFNIVGCLKETQNDGVIVGFVTDTGGIADKSFNQTCYEGAKKFYDDHGLSVNNLSYVESKNDIDFMPNLTTFADDGVDLLIASGFLFSNAVTEVALKYPKQHIVLIDVGTLDVSKVPNVLQCVFSEHEGSFLVGIIAGLAALDAGKKAVGYITGMESDIMNKFEAGFQQGVWQVYPECKIIRSNMNSFSDVALGQQTASAIYNKGAYAIFTAAGSAGQGVLNEAANRKRKGEDIWAIGVDTDQYDHGRYKDINGDEKSAVLTSMMKRVDTAVYSALSDETNKKFVGGVREFSLKEHGVGLAPSSNINCKPEWLKKAQNYADKVISGQIEVFKTPKKIGEDPRVVGL